MLDLIIITAAAALALWLACDYSPKPAKRRTPRRRR